MCLIRWCIWKINPGTNAARLHHSNFSCYSYKLTLRGSWSELNFSLYAINDKHLMATSELLILTVENVFTRTVGVGGNYLGAPKYHDTKSWRPWQFPSLMKLVKFYGWQTASPLCVQYKKLRSILQTKGWDMEMKAVKKIQATCPHSWVFWIVHSVDE